MTKFLIIVGIAFATTACGQAGDLYLPTEPSAADRATLTESIFGGHAAAPQPPASAASAPATQP